MDDVALGRFLDAVFDFTCERRVSELIDVDRLLAGVDAVTSEPRLGRLIARLVGPVRARILDRARASSRPLSAWLPDPVRDALAVLLAQPVPIPRALVDKIVTDDHVRQSARAMMQEALSSFIQKAFSVTPGGRGLRGVIGLGARAAGGLLGGLGDELQRQLEERVRDFVDGGVQMMEQRLAQRVASEETARILGQRRRTIFLELLKQPESEAERLAGRVPWAVIDAVLPSVVTHNLQRAEVRAALREEMAAVVAELSMQTIGELLDDLGLRQLVREGLHAHGLPLARAFLTSPQFSRATE